MKILDSTFLIDLLRGDKSTLKIIQKKENFLTTQINMYEVIRGLFMRNMSPKKLLDGMTLFEEIRVLPLDDSAVVKSAEISAELIKKGKTLADCDCLIAGIALSKGVSTIVTRNTNDFKRIKGIKVQSY